MSTFGAVGLGSAKERGGGALRMTLFPQVYTHKSIGIGLLAPRPADVEGRIRQNEMSEMIKLSAFAL